jgi:hypothetical protein
LSSCQLLQRIDPCRMKPRSPFGEHRGTGFAGPLVLPPVRAEGQRLQACLRRLGRPEEPRPLAAARLADHTKWGSLGVSVIFSELLGAEQREDQVGEQDYGQQACKSVQHVEADHRGSPRGASSLPRPSTASAMTTHNTAIAAIHTKSISQLLYARHMRAVSRGAHKDGEQSRGTAVKKA